MLNAHLLITSQRSADEIGWVSTGVFSCPEMKAEELGTVFIELDEANSRSKSPNPMTISIIPVQWKPKDDKRTESESDEEMKEKQKKALESEVGRMRRI